MSQCLFWGKTWGSCFFFQTSEIGDGQLLPTRKCGGAHHPWTVSVVIIWNLRGFRNISVVMLNNGHPLGGGNVA